MRFILAIATLLVSSSLFASQPLLNHDATFTGSGEWKSTCGENGTYDETLVFSGNEMTGTITSEGETFTYTLAYVMGENGFFQVTGGKDQSAVIGGGYCFGYLCHYGIKMGKMGLEETFYFKDDTLYSTGSKFSMSGGCGGQQGQQGQCPGQQCPAPGKGQSCSKSACGGAMAWQGTLLKTPAPKKP